MADREKRRRLKQVGEFICLWKDIVHNRCFSVVVFYIVLYSDATFDGFKSESGFADSMIVCLFQFWFRSDSLTRGEVMKSKGRRKAFCCLWKRERNEREQQKEILPTATCQWPIKDGRHTVLSCSDIPWQQQKSFVDNFIWINTRLLFAVSENVPTYLPTALPGRKQWPASDWAETPDQTPNVLQTSFEAERSTCVTELGSGIQHLPFTCPVTTFREATGTVIPSVLHCCGQSASEARQKLTDCHV